MKGYCQRIWGQIGCRRWLVWAEKCLGWARTLIGEVKLHFLLCLRAPCIRSPWWTAQQWAVCMDSMKQQPQQIKWDDWMRMANLRCCRPSLHWNKYRYHQTHHNGGKYMRWSFLQCPCKYFSSPRQGWTQGWDMPVHGWNVKSHQTQLRHRSWVLKMAREANYTSDNIVQAKKNGWKRNCSPKKKIDGILNVIKHLSVELSTSWKMGDGTTEVSYLSDYISQPKNSPYHSGQKNTPKPRSEPKPDLNNTTSRSRGVQKVSCHQYELRRQWAALPERYAERICIGQR
jgi:hypothetical protein